MGTSSAPETVQNTIQHQVVMNMPNADNVNVFGEIKEEHDERLDKVCSRLAECDQTASLTNVKRIENANELASFLRLAVYCGSYIPNLATLIEPQLWKVARSKEPFHWNEIHGKSLSQVKNALIKFSLAHFNPQLEIEVSVDASQVGISAIRTQFDPGTEKRRLVFCVSKKLSDTESRYSCFKKMPKKCICFLRGKIMGLISDLAKSES